MTKTVNLRFVASKRETGNCDDWCNVVNLSAMRWVFLSMFVCGFVTACAPVGPDARDPTPQAESDQIRPQARPSTLASDAVAPPVSATTAEDFDTTTPEQRNEAATAPADASSERALGTTVASLGTPSEPGFWLKTPLVATEGAGRVVYPQTGKSAAVTLIPIDGEATAGSRMSLAALRLIGAPLTGLPVVEVYSQ